MRKNSVRFSRPFKRMLWLAAVALAISCVCLYYYASCKVVDQVRAEFKAHFPLGSNHDQVWAFIRSRNNIEIETPWYDHRGDPPRQEIVCKILNPLRDVYVIFFFDHQSRDPKVDCVCVYENAEDVRRVFKP